MEKIVEYQLKLLEKRLKDRDIALSWSAEATAYLAKEGYDPRFGARPLKRYIQNAVVNPLSKGILENKIPPGSHVQLDFEDGQIAYKL